MLLFSSQTDTHKHNISLKLLRIDYSLAQTDLAIALKRNSATFIITSTTPLTSLSIKQNSTVTSSCYDHPIMTFYLPYNPRLTGTFSYTSNYHTINPNVVPCL